jgi:hypothetical protein
MIRYCIGTWQESWDQKWRFCIWKKMRVTFKRSGRVGWRKLGFVRTDISDSQKFDTRAQALAAAKATKENL